MEILEILKCSKDELIPEDLEIFKTELIVGNYSDDYKKECLEMIEKLESCNKSVKPPEKKSKAEVETAQFKPVNQNAAKLSFTEQFNADMNAIRLSGSYKTKFKTYIKNHDKFDESFVDENFNLFDSKELDVIISELQLSESFLEKYYSVLDKDKIARYQLFSEKFYMKHFSDFDTETVLKKGKNEWRKKENRSRQFDVFLRLKGVKV